MHRLSRHTPPSPHAPSPSHGPTGAMQVPTRSSGGGGGGTISPSPSPSPTGGGSSPPPSWACATLESAMRHDTRSSLRLDIELAPSRLFPERKKLVTQDFVRALAR